MLIKSLRQKKCISQEQLAEVTGLSLRTIQRVESGQKVSDSSLQSLAEYFEIDIASIGNEVGEMTSEEETGYANILARLTYHRAIQLIIIVVTFFIFAIHWINYYSSMNPGPDNASLGYILLIVSEIAAAAALLAYFFGRAPALFIRSYYFTAATFLAIAIAIEYWMAANYEGESTTEIFAVYYTLMFLTLCVFHILQMALSLNSESTVVIQLSSKLTHKVMALKSDKEPAIESNGGMITN